MVNNLEHFEKFIVKHIVNTVKYHPETDEYEINRIHISDDIINVIENEGVRYGVKRSQIGQIISLVAEKIRTTPSVKLNYGSIDVDKLKTGQHFRINILHPDKGAHYIELITLDKFCFYVLDSDIIGICYGDVLHALDSFWNNAYYIDFTVTRNNKKYPNGKTILRLGKLQNIWEYSPSVVHNILDSESTFTYESVNANQKETRGFDEGREQHYFFWIPNKWRPITFSWEEGDIQDNTSAFIITDNEDTTAAKITINNDFQLPTDEEMLNQFVKILFDCCKSTNNFNGVDNLKCIKSVKAGTVKRVVSELGHKEWALINQPQIKFVYE